MSINTSKIKVQPLRGMDTRYNPMPTKARLITDMTWTLEDSWKHGSGFDYATISFGAKDIEVEGRIQKQKNQFEPVRNKVFLYPSLQVVAQPDLACPTSTEQLIRTPDANYDDIDGTNDRYYFETIINDSNLEPDIKLESVQDDFFVSLIDNENREVERLSGSNPKTVDNTYQHPGHEGIVNMHWFAQYNGGIQWILYETEDGTLFRFFGSGGNFYPYLQIYHLDGYPIVGPAWSFGSSTNLTRHRRHVKLNTPSSGTNFYTFADRVYMVNEYNEPLVYDGRFCSLAGYQYKPKIKDVRFCKADNSQLQYKAYSRVRGIGYNADHMRPDPDLPDEEWESMWKYSYRVTFLNERGQESPMSEPMVISGQNKYTSVNNELESTGYSMYAITSVTLPIGPVGTVARRIYRTQNLFDAANQPRPANFSVEHYFVTEIRDNVTKLFNDSYPDNELGALNSIELRTWPASTNRIATFKNTMFLASSNENLLYFSSPRQPEEIPVDNFFEVGDAVSGNIVGLYPTKNALVIFKRFGIYLIKGDPLNGFFTFTLTKDVGCSASKSIREIPGKGLAFMGDDGVYLLEGALENTGTITGITRISDAIQKVFRRYNRSASESIRTCINKRQKEFWLSIPADSEIRPNLMLKFHYEIGEWSISENFRTNDFLCTEDHRSYVYLGTSDTDTSRKGLMYYSDVHLNKGTSPVEPSYKTSHMAVGSIYQSFDVVRVQVMAVSYGENTINCNFLVNREANDSLSNDLTRKQKRPLEDLSASLFNTAIGDGTFTYSEHRPVPIRFDVTTMNKGPVQEISFSFVPADQRIEIMGYMMEVRLGGAKEVVTLTEIFGGDLTR